MRFLICIYFFFSALAFLNAQETSADTIPKASLTPKDTTLVFKNQKVKIEGDSVIVEDKKKKKKLRGFFTKDYPIPKRAMLLSFVIPGAGQAYNKKFWKIPLAVGGSLTALYFVRENTQTYRLLRDQLRLRYDEDLDIEVDPRFTSWSNEDLMRERDLRNKWKESSYIALVLVQALGGVDAFVDAHMHGYKINEDLSMKIKPSVESTTGFGPVVGLGVSFHLNNPSPPIPKEFAVFAE